MDDEEWYHLDYINNNHNIEYNRSVKDGIERYLQILTYFKIRSNFFVVGEIIEKISTILFEIKSRSFPLIVGAVELDKRFLYGSSNKVFSFVKFFRAR